MAELRAKLSLDSSEFESGINHALGSVESFIPALAGIGSVAGIGILTEQALEFSRGILEASHATGVSTDAIQRLAGAANEFHIDLDTVSKSLEKMMISVAKANDGDAKMIEAFHQLGINLKEFQALSPDQQLLKLAESASLATDKGMALHDLQEILGKSFRDIIPLINNVEEAKRVAANTPIASKEELENAEEFDRLIRSIALHAKTMTLTIMEGVKVLNNSFGPGVDKAFELLTGEAPEVPKHFFRLQGNAFDTEETGDVSSKALEKRERLIKQIDEQMERNKESESGDNEEKLKVLEARRKQLAEEDSAARQESKGGDSERALMAELSILKVDNEILAVQKRISEEADRAEKKKELADKELLRKENRLADEQFDNSLFGKNLDEKERLLRDRVRDFEDIAKQLDRSGEQAGALDAQMEAEKYRTELDHIIDLESKEEERDEHRKHRWKEFTDSLKNIGGTVGEGRGISLIPGDPAPFAPNSNMTDGGNIGGAMTNRLDLLSGLVTGGGVMRHSGQSIATARGVAMSSFDHAAQTARNTAEIASILRAQKPHATKPPPISSP